MLHRPTVRKAGFTLVELLVVIAIIGVLVGLLLPAVQAAREAGRRASCQNNMRQVGIALQNYHDTNRVFPRAGFLRRPNGSQTPGAYHHTWLTSLLPFLEQKPLHDNINFNAKAWGQAVVAADLKVLKCPSDGGYRDASETHGIAFTNYAGAEGYHWHPMASLNPASGGAYAQLPIAGDYAGLFACERTFDMASISDGTSNSVVVAETDSYGWKSGGFQTTGTGMRRQRGEGVFRSAFVYTSVNGTTANETGIMPPFQEVDDSGTKTNGKWFRSAPYCYPPSYITAWGINTDWPGAGSNHSGGIILATRGDGSVGTYRENIGWGVWVAVNGIADGGTVKGD